MSFWIFFLLLLLPFSYPFLSLYLTEWTQTFQLGSFPSAGEYLNLLSQLFLALTHLPPHYHWSYSVFLILLPVSFTRRDHELVKDPLKFSSLLDFVTFLANLDPISHCSKRITASSTAGFLKVRQLLSSWSFWSKSAQKEKLNPTLVQCFCDVSLLMPL